MIHKHDHRLFGCFIYKQYKYSAKCKHDTRQFLSESRLLPLIAGARFRIITLKNTIHNKRGTRHERKKIYHT